MDLREAAEALGVHYQTAYAWVREGTLPARKVGRGYEVGDAGVQALAARRRQGHEPPRPIHVRDWPAQAQALYAAITQGEETRARHQVERLASGVRVVDLCEQVIAPALRRVGDEWAAGRVSIAQEHRASAICERLLASQTRQPAGRPRGTAVVAPRPANGTACRRSWPPPAFARTAGSSITWPAICPSRRSPGSPAGSAPTSSCCHPP